MRSCIFPSTAASLFLLITGRKECSLFFVDYSGKECSLFLLITGRKECTLFLLIPGRKECTPACLKAHLLCQWTRSWAGLGGLSWSRCSPTSAMSIRFPDRVIAHPSKGQLHPAHWASPVLGLTQFEHMVLNYFSWGPVQFLFFQLQFSLLSTSDKADCMLNAGWFS